MKRFRTGAETAGLIADQSSSLLLTRLLRRERKGARVDFASLGLGDQIARHRVGLPRLFNVLEGPSRVIGGDEIDHPI